MTAERPLLEERGQTPLNQKLVQHTSDGGFPSNNFVCTCKRRILNVLKVIKPDQPLYSSQNSYYL